MKKNRYLLFIATALVLLIAVNSQAQTPWDLANKNKDLLRISTLFTAQNVRDYLGDEKGIDEAIDWCKKTGVTHVFLESFRSRYTADRKALEDAKKRFIEEGFDVSGCVTTTQVGKISTGWKVISCYTNKRTQQQLQEIFEYTASIFDEIMIDDFLFTDCQCNECKTARGGKSWADYRCELMIKMSRDRILGPAKVINPDVEIIIKYPQWYDNFHNRGYEVVRQTADYDKIWVGTETRDYEDKRWGGKVQYEAYYIMRWLGGIGGAKTGGGWFDPYGTTEDTYLEQARQTVLADASEMLLFCYGSLLRNTGHANIKKLREEMPGLFKLARLVRNKPIKGIHAPKPPNSDAYDEQYVYDFVGMLGLPLVPAAEVCSDAKAAFFPVHAIKDPGLANKLKTMLSAGKTVLITDGLAKRLSGEGLDLNNENLVILEVKGNPKNLLELTREQINPIRNRLLKPLGIKFDAPNKVALYLIGEDCLVVENFNDVSIDVTITLSRHVQARKKLVLPNSGNVNITSDRVKLDLSKMSPRSLVVIELSIRS
jgi:hypothetical protein